MDKLNSTLTAVRNLRSNVKQCFEHLADGTDGEGGEESRNKFVHEFQERFGAINLQLRWVFTLYAQGIYLKVLSQISREVEQLINGLQVPPHLIPWETRLIWHKRHPRTGRHCTLSWWTATSGLIRCTTTVSWPSTILTRTHWGDPTTIAHKKDNVCPSPPSTMIQSKSWWLRPNETWLIYRLY